MLAAAQAGTMLLDYSFAKAALIPQLGQAKAEGYVGAVRYLSGIAEKDIDAAERDAYAAAGMGLAAVWQTSGRPDLSGDVGGRSHCYSAFAQWAALGAPAGSVIFWACDTNAVSWPQVRPYAQAWHAAAQEQGSTYRTGAYGPSRVVEAAMDEGLAEFAWQPETWWDTQRRRPDVHLIQMVNSRRGTFGGSSVDENQVFQPIPLWMPGGTDGLDLQVFRPATSEGDNELKEDERAILLKLNGVLNTEYPGWGRPGSTNDVLAIFSQRFDQLAAEVAALKAAPAAQVPSAEAIAAEIIRQLRP